jgi:formylglycine-generating enzyme required for sulfatase activity
VKSFYLGRYEVTNRDYAEFLRETAYAKTAFDGVDPAPFVEREGGRPGPKGWRDGKPREGTEDDPVTGVSWFEAEAYARWFAKKKGLPYRLPTDDEWELAARLASATAGTTRLLAFPWGDEWGTQGARLARAAEERRGPSPVRANGAHPEDRSACNVNDMAGNVSEWVNPGTAGDRGSVRGGSFFLPYAEACAPAHRATPRKMLRSEAVGFRLALGAAANEKSDDEKGKDK